MSVDPKVKNILSTEDISIHEAREILIETQKKAESLGIKAPEITDMIEYTSVHLKLFGGKSLDAQEAKRLRERLQGLGIEPKYAVTIVDHLPVKLEELREILPEEVYKSLEQEKREEVINKIASILKERF